MRGVGLMIRTFGAAALFISAVQGNDAALASERAPIGLANPASAHCGKLGGRLQIVSEGNRGQVGYCHLSDGRVCEEWALFRDGKCIAPKRSR